MDGTVTKIIKDTKQFLLSNNFGEQTLYDRRRIDAVVKRLDFAIEVNTEIDTIIDKMKEIVKEDK